MNDHRRKPAVRTYLAYFDGRRFRTLSLFHSELQPRLTSGVVGQRFQGHQSAECGGHPRTGKLGNRVGIGMALSFPLPMCGADRRRAAAKHSGYLPRLLLGRGEALQLRTAFSGAANWIRY